MGKREPQRQRGAMKMPGRSDSIRLLDNIVVTWLCISYLTFTRKCEKMLMLYWIWLNRGPFTFTWYLPNLFFFFFNKSNCLKPFKSVVLCFLWSYVSPHSRTLGKNGQKPVRRRQEARCQQRRLRSSEWTQQKRHAFQKKPALSVHHTDLRGFRNQIRVPSPDNWCHRDPRDPQISINNQL